MEPYLLPETLGGFTDVIVNPSHLVGLDVPSFSSGNMEGEFWVVFALLVLERRGSILSRLPQAPVNLLKVPAQRRPR